MATSTITQHDHEQSLEKMLRDYTLHLSASSSGTLEDQARSRTPSVTPNRCDPPNWPTQYRRIPPHRPINCNLDRSERPNGSNRAELLFVTVMMNGVRLQSGLVRAWEQTGGHWYPGLTRYRIGGEW